MRRRVQLVHDPGADYESHVRDQTLTCSELRFEMMPGTAFVNLYALLNPLQGTSTVYPLTNNNVKLARAAAKEK